MSDEQEDYLGLIDADERQQRRWPAFVTSPPMGQAELLAAQAMHLEGLRNKKFAGATEPVFVVEEGGEELVEESEAARWRALMGWPETARLPTLAEVEQFQRARDRRLYAAHWERLRAAVLEDEATKAEADARRTAGIIKNIRK
jgi:hypothetical protein